MTAEPFLINKIQKKIKEDNFDIEKIFDHNHKPGKEVKVAKKEKKKVKENLAFSFNTRDQGRIAKSYKTHLPFK